MNVGRERRKTEISTSMGSGDQWEDRSGRGEDWRKRRGEEGRRGDAQEEGSSRGHEELEASAKERVMTRLPDVPDVQQEKEKEGKEKEHFRNKEGFRNNFSQASFLSKAVPPQGGVAEDGAQQRR